MNGSKIIFGPRHLFYITRIYAGDFDRDFRAGRYVHDKQIVRAIRELLGFGMISYDGAHHLTDSGVKTLRDFLSLEGEAGLFKYSILLEIDLEQFDTRLQCGLISEQSKLTNTIGDLMDEGFVKYDGLHTCTLKGTNRILDFTQSIPPFRG